MYYEKLYATLHLLIVPWSNDIFQMVVEPISYHIISVDCVRMFDRLSPIGSI